MVLRHYLAAAAAAFLTTPIAAQTWTKCNPLTSTCPDDPALGQAISIDFTKGEVNSFTSAGGTPSYGSDGVSFTVAASGDSPQLISLFYIMFGRVECTMKAAPGTGIVSSLVLQSDDLDEIDLEWLGADNSQVQTNYFGKGITGNYDRGQFNPAAGNQDRFITYTIDWNAERIIWYVDGTVIRTLTASQAGNQYPQTPMTVRFGAWSGGDPSNNQGTIEWAGGYTNYAAGPYSMVVKSLSVTDYSTGSAYRYTDNSGSWTSIQAVDGKVNGNSNGAGEIKVTASAGVAQAGSPTVPVGGIDGGSSTSTPTGWPWDADATESTGAVPSGWVMTTDGKIVPSTSSTIDPTPSSSRSQPSSSASSSESTSTSSDDASSSKKSTKNTTTPPATTLVTATAVVNATAATTTGSAGAANTEAPANDGARAASGMLTGSLLGLAAVAVAVVM